MGAQKCRLRGLSATEYSLLLEMCRYANSLANAAEWHIRHFRDRTGRYLSYEKNNQISKKNVNYRLLQANCAQQILKRQDAKHQSFFALLKAKKAGTYTGEVNPPRYRQKGGYDSLIIAGDFIIDRGDGYFVIPMSREFRKKHPGEEVRIRKPSNLAGRRIRQLEIRPAKDGTYIEAVFSYEEKPQNLGLDVHNTLCLDLGVDNFAAGVTGSGTTFPVDGRRMKAINRQFNKRKAEIQAVLKKENGQSWSRRLTRIAKKRDNQITDFMRKAAKECIRRCIADNCGTLIVGVNEDWKQNCAMGTVSNQRFCSIPHAKFRQMLKAQCSKYGIRYVEQEESYTSKASALDGDCIPTWNAGSTGSHSFSGKRVKRGLYRTEKGILINADINGALNIGRKSKQNDPALSGIRLCMGGLDSPVRVWIV